MSLIFCISYVCNKIANIFSFAKAEQKNVFQIQKIYLDSYCANKLESCCVQKKLLGVLYTGADDKLYEILYLNVCVKKIYFIKWLNCFLLIFLLPLFCLLFTIIEFL